MEKLANVREGAGNRRGVGGGLDLRGRDEDTDDAQG